MTTSERYLLLVVLFFVLRVLWFEFGFQRAQKMYKKTGNIKYLHDWFEKNK